MDERLLQGYGLVAVVAVLVPVLLVQLFFLRKKFEITFGRTIELTEVLCDSCVGIALRELWRRWCRQPEASDEQAAPQDEPLLQPDSLSVMQRT